MMFMEKPKRKSKHQKKSLTRFLLISLIIVPGILFALNPAFGQSLLADGIALSVMICAAVYIVHQGVLWLIASYLNIPGKETGDTVSEITII